MSLLIAWSGLLHRGVSVVGDYLPLRSMDEPYFTVRYWKLPHFVALGEL